MVSLWLHSLALSDFYVDNKIYGSVMVQFIPLCFASGAIVPILCNKFSAVNRFEFSNTRRSGYNINVAIATCVFFGTFIVEAILFGLPILSQTPTKSYMDYGLPFIHHLTTFGYFAIFLIILSVKLSNANKITALLVIILVLISYAPILARMQILNVFLITIFSGYYLFNWSNKRILIYAGVILSAFVALFIYIGLLRIGNSSGYEYFDKLSRINCDCLGPFGILYLYFSISVQNTINLINLNDNYYLGLYSVLNIIPKLDPIDLLNADITGFRASPGLTTFVFGSSLWLDFGLFSLFFIVAIGFFVGLVYCSFRRGMIFSAMFYICGLVKLLIFSFFSDSFFTTGLLISLLFAISLKRKYVFRK